MNRYPRDMQGHGQTPPNANWPDGAKVAVQFVVNYEEGGENNILHGDAALNIASCQTMLVVGTNLSGCVKTMIYSLSVMRYCWTVLCMTARQKLKDRTRQRQKKNVSKNNDNIIRVHY